jgi:hypothetical protein
MASPVVEVVRQEGDHVLVSLPLVGFPPGFEVKPGTLVVVGEGGEGFGEAQPLVHEMVVQQPLSEPGAQLFSEWGAQLMADGEEAFEVQPATIRDQGGGPPYVVTVLERAEASERTGVQVVSVRSMSPESLES